ncbi:MAG: hypothetical protein DRN66_00595 [Candidatus Nanohalarchaeota archaeon]|nr:MAG: hypothetical protein DRN66_00595 [Candidatus Nanohaloarchaeota archaeon]
MQTVILCGGKSSRFWPLGYDRHKCFSKIMGKTLLEYTIESASKITKDIIIIKRQDFDEKSIDFEKYRAQGINVCFREQKRSLGMGDALLCAKEQINDDFFVVFPNNFACGDLMKKMLKGTDVLLGQKTNNPQLYGVFGFENKKPVKIVEKPKKGKEPSNIRIAGTYHLSKKFLNILKAQKTSEYNFEEALSIHLKRNNVELELINEELNSLKYPFHLLAIKNRIFDMSLKPIIQKSAKIAESAIIGKNVHIGKNTTIMEGAVVKNNVYIGNNCIVGNHCVVRDYCNIEDNIVIGAHSEVKNSIMYSGTSIHRSYIGDSIIGQNCRFGACCITSNRLFRKQGKRPEIKCFIEAKKKYVNTGLTSLGIICADNVDVGTNVNFMPAVMIEADSRITPNSLVKGNVKGKPYPY